MRTVWLLALPGCFLSPIPDSRTPQDRAHELDAKCRSADVRAAVARPESVERDIVYVAGGPNGREARFRGARIHLGPAVGASHEAIERGLMCHQADVVLGRAPTRDDDPYVLPGHWLAIEVESTGDGFVAHVRAERIDDAKAVLDRAQTFDRQSAPASAGPASPPLGQPLPLQ